MSTEPYALIPLSQNPVIAKFDDLDDVQSWLAIDMTLIHNVFIRGLNSIWRNAPLVKPADVNAFAGYCLTCTAFIHYHHHGEESLIFPFLQTKLDMGHNLEQHRAFQEGMDAFESYIKNVEGKKEEYDGAKARHLLEAFAGPLIQHLHDEIPTISPERMKAFDDDKEGLRGMVKKFEEHLKAQPDKLAVFPFAATHHVHKEAPNWPPAPALIMWFAKNIAPWRHPRQALYWKFSPFTTNGEPQTLYGTA
ncbi:hypothetical protein BDZ97DRAFT_1659789 [Flammula alnicola]|nr:hypothetical protein BDZ97DRAFT_1659789 [Flammula alnicola]